MRECAGISLERRPVLVRDLFNREGRPSRARTKNHARGGIPRSCHSCQNPDRDGRYQRGVAAESTIDRLRPDETDAGATLLARSFVDERIFAYIFEGRDRDRVERATGSGFGRGSDHAYRLGRSTQPVLTERSSESGPHPSWSLPADGAAQFRFMRGLMGGMLRMAMTSRRALRLGSFARQLARLEPDEPFWNLVWVGVDPALQRHGIGSALADEVIRLADSSSTACWLVTFGPHTRSLYECPGASSRLRCSRLQTARPAGLSPGAAPAIEPTVLDESPRRANETPLDATSIRRQGGRMPQCAGMSLGSFV